MYKKIYKLFNFLGVLIFLVFFFNVKAESVDAQENKTTYTVGLISSYSPLSYMDESGNPSGIMVDLMELLSSKKNINFEYKFLAMGQTGKSFLDGKEGDMVVGVADSELSSINPTLIKSKAILDCEIVLVGKKGRSFASTDSFSVAIGKNFIGGKENVLKRFPNASVVPGENNTECLNFVRDGKTDVLLQNIYVIREWLQSPYYSDLEIYPAHTFEEKEVIVSDNQDIIDLVNSGIDMFSTDEVDDVVIKHTVAKVHNTTAAELFYQFRAVFISIIISFVLVVGLILTIAIVRIKSEKELKKKNLLLTEANTQLVDAVEQTKLANKAKSQFLARMSHEIRTPLNAIVGMTTLAKFKEDEPEVIDDYLGKIEGASHILLDLVNDILDMSAIEKDKIKISNTEFDIKDVLNSISNVYYPQCKAKNIDYFMGADLNEEKVIGDSLRVKQIIMNLVSNAYKFTNSGGLISITATETKKTQDSVFVRFVVKDTGIGMNEDMLSRIFKPFEQETAETAQKTGGSGLGLSIVYNLVNLMNGAISVESKKNEGTEFVVDLPFNLVNEKRVINPEKLKDMRALVVDDDENARKYTGVVLERIGVKYDLAASADEAIELLNNMSANNMKYDICFTDWKMNGMNGVELTKKIRNDFNKETLIIIISAYDIAEIIDEGKEAGANYFITKPLFQSTVFDCLAQLTGGIVKLPKKDIHSYDFSGHKCLIAEDISLNAEIVTKILSIAHMDVEVAQNGKIALDMFNNSKPGTYDMILMDIQMPEMNGYEATKAIRSSNHIDAKKIPIYAMTANAFPEDISKSISAGMNGHLSKPIDISLLFTTIEQELKKKINSD